MSEPKAQAKVHSELGASVANRWMNCPGSVRLIRTLPASETNTTSEYAEEGTRAHAVAELALTLAKDASAFLGETVEGGEVNEEMVEAVNVFIDHVLGVIGGPFGDGVQFWVERKFDLDALNPPEPMFGTADFVAYAPQARRLFVSDLKYGKGVVVEVKGNKQLRFYGLGSLLSIDLATMPVDDVAITIVQPRALHPDGFVRSEVLTVSELMEFAVELLDAARKTQEPDAPLVAGDWCRFCPAAGVCPARRDYALAVAQQEFALAEEFVPPPPDTIPIEELAAMAKKFYILRDWMNASEAAIRARLERGDDVPGFKLVAKRPVRRWIDEDKVEEVLKQEGYETEEIYTLELKSPAQVEKLLKKKKFGQTLGSLVKKESSGYNVAPDTDPRPALLPPGSIDRLLPAGDTQPGSSDETKS